MYEKEMISIIIPAYNCGSYIGHTIESIKNQTYKNYEIIIVDDFSPDNTSEVVSEIIKENKDININYINLERNMGAAAARNAGIREAKGQYLSFIDSDDIVSPDAFEKQLIFLKKKKANVVFSSHDYIDEFNNKIKTPFIVPEKVDYKGILKTCPVKPFTVLIDRNYIKQEIIMPEEAVKREDLGCWTSLLKEVTFFHGNKEVLGSYRILKNSVSRNKIKMCYYQWRFYREVEKINFFKSLYFFFNWGFQGVLKYYV